MFWMVGLGIQIGCKFSIDVIKKPTENSPVGLKLFCIDIFKGDAF